MPPPIINILISRTCAYVSIDGKRNLQSPQDFVVNNLQMERLPLIIRMRPIQSPRSFLNYIITWDNNFYVPSSTNNIIL